MTGASSGSVPTTARAVAAGARVALLARRVERLRELATEVDGVLVDADVTDLAGVPAAVDTAARRLGGLDAVVNAAGTMHAGRVAETDPQRWREMFDVNVVGLLAVTAAAVPHLRAGVAPSVVNVSSMSGRRVASAEGGIYAASKFAVHAAGESLRQELASDGIRVTTVAPGFVRTDLVADWPDGELKDRFGSRMSELGLDPWAVADAVLHVLSRPAGVTVVEYAVMSSAQLGGS